MSCHNKKLVNFSLYGLSLYLVLLTSLALFHAYENSELSDHAGCSIGLWVQHGQALQLTTFVLPVILTCLFLVALPIEAIHYRLPISGLTARAPPLSI